jgi:hypothetical protein
MLRRITSLGLAGTLCAVLSVVLVPSDHAVAGTTTVPQPDHVVIVVDENHSSTNILGNPNAPYINALANQNATFTQSYALTHPSQPNYIALFSGSTQGVTDDSCPHSFAAPSLGDQLIGAGRTFVGYSETLPSPGFTGCSSGKYAAKHSPWVNFPSLPSSTNQPLSAFPTDFSTLPDVSFVIPNLDNDMHDGTVAQGDAWLQSHLDGYITWAKTHNSLFVLTFDEDDLGDNNRIPTIMAGARVTPGSYTETINHYSVLRTVQDAFGLAPLANSATAQPILDVWSPGAGNQGPTAAFTSTCSVQSCSFDASGSSDPDGTVNQYTWDFGDGSSGSGSSANHTFAGSGTFPVRLTVADNGGATDSVTHEVSVSAPVSSPFVVDSFGRTVANGWGTADVGGVWSLTGTASAFSVAGGVGSIRHGTAGSQVTGTLAAVSSSDTDLALGFNVDKLTAGYYLTATGRRVSVGNEYRARVLVGSTNKVSVLLTKLVGGVQTSISVDRVVAGLTYAPGLALRLRLQVTGTSPTTVRAKVWAASGSEPSDWLVSATDSNAGLQGPGAVALTSYLSSNATNAPAVARISDLSARPTVTTPPPNQPPTARFTSSCTDLGCGFDGSTSSDPEGAVTYA